VIQKIPLSRLRLCVFACVWGGGVSCVSERESKREFVFVFACVWMWVFVCVVCHVLGCLGDAENSVEGGFVCVSKRESKREYASVWVWRSVD